MLLTVPVRGPISGISLPRDTEMPDHHKLCEESAHHGIKEMVRRVSVLAGTPVTGYVALRMDRLPAFVDKWLPNGVPIRVEREIRYEDKAGHLKYHLRAGDQSLHGHDLLAYARHRKGDPRGDLGRIDRQRQVIKAILRALAAPTNLPRLSAILNDLSATGSTNLTTPELAGLLLLLREEGGLRLQVAPCTPFYRGKRSLVRLNVEALRKQLRPAGSGARIPEHLRVTVLNGGRRPGAARRAAELLRSEQGIQTADIGNAPEYTPRTRISFWPEESRSLAEAVARTLGVDAEVAACPPSASAPAGLKIIIGEDLALPAATLRPGAQIEKENR
jgi:LCP family protein required for cell wall assembly